MPAGGLEGSVIVMPRNLYRIFFPTSIVRALTRRASLVLDRMIAGERVALPRRWMEALAFALYAARDRRDLGASR